MTTSKEFENTLQAQLSIELACDLFQIRVAQTLEDAGVSDSAHGLVVHTEDGSSFQLTIVKLVGPQCRFCGDRSAVEESDLMCTGCRGVERGLDVFLGSKRGRDLARMLLAARGSKA